MSQKKATIPPFPIGNQGRRRLLWGRQGISVTLLLLALIAVLVPASARDFPPVVPPPEPVRLREPTVHILPNGLKVLVIERHALPLVTLRLVIRAGAEADPPDLPGTAELVADVLDQGTTHRTAMQIAQEVDSAGGVVDTGAEWDSSYASLSVLADHAKLAFNLLADIVINPAFKPAEVDRQRRQTLSALEVVKDDPSYIADATLREVAFAGTPYSHPESGTRKAVEKITPADLRAFHARYYQPSNAILAVVGDISTTEALARAKQAFGIWKNHPVAPITLNNVPKPGFPKVVVVDRPAAVQTEIRIGYPGIRRNSPDYYALAVANQILGGPAANHLFRALRSENGLTYGASSNLVCERSTGVWVAKTSTRTAETIKSLEVALDQVHRLRSDPISEQDVDTAKGYLVGHLALQFETSDDIATRFLDLMVHNLPLNYWNLFPEKVQAVTMSDVHDVIRRYLNPTSSVMVLVGNASAFEEDLKKFGPSRIIPLSQLDFALADLERMSSTPGKQ